MNLKQMYNNLFVKEPEKTFIKIGIMNEDRTLTSDGKDLYLNWEFEKNKDAFKKEVADPILEDMKKDEAK